MMTATQRTTTAPSQSKADWLKKGTSSGRLTVSLVLRYGGCGAEERPWRVPGSAGRPNTCRPQYATVASMPVLPPVSSGRNDRPAPMAPSLLSIGDGRR